MLGFNPRPSGFWVLALNRVLSCLFKGSFRFWAPCGFELYERTHFLLAFSQLELGFCHWHAKESPVIHLHTQCSLCLSQSPSLSPDPPLHLLRSEPRCIDLHSEFTTFWYKPVFGSYFHSSSTKISSLLLINELSNLQINTSSKSIDISVSVLTHVTMEEIWSNISQSLKNRSLF